MVVHQCGYKHVFVGNCFVETPFHSVDTDMVAHQCGYEYVELNYSFLQTSYHNVGTDMVAHQCGCEYVELNYSFLRTSYHNVGTDVVDDGSVVFSAYFCWSQARNKGLVVACVCCDVS